MLSSSSRRRDSTSTATSTTSSATTTSNRMSNNQKNNKNKESRQPVCSYWKNKKQQQKQQEHHDQDEQGGQQHNDQEEEEMWNCDVCKIASFRNYNDAVLHEATCQGRAERGKFTEPLPPHYGYNDPRGICTSSIESSMAAEQQSALLGFHQQLQHRPSCWQQPFLQQKQPQQQGEKVEKEKNQKGEEDRQKINISSSPSSKLSHPKRGQDKNDNRTSDSSMGHLGNKYKTPCNTRIHSHATAGMVLMPGGHQECYSRHQNPITNYCLPTIPPQSQIQNRLPEGHTTTAATTSPINQHQVESSSYLEVISDTAFDAHPSRAYHNATQPRKMARISPSSPSAGMPQESRPLSPLLAIGATQPTKIAAAVPKITRLPQFTSHSTQNAQNIRPDTHGNESSNKTVVTTVWICDFCHAQEFESYQEAINHEAICAHRPTIDGNASSQNHNHNNNKSNSQKKKSAEDQKIRDKKAGGDITSQQREKSPNGQVACTVPASSMVPRRNPALDIIIPPPVTEPIPKGSSKPLEGNCFACDVCKKAYFRSFEEALVHEKLCQLQRDRNFALAKYRSVHRKFLAQETARKIQEQQGVVQNRIPNIVQGGCTSYANNNSSSGTSELRKGAVRAISLPTSPLKKSKTLVKQKSVDAVSSLNEKIESEETVEQPRATREAYDDKEDAVSTENTICVASQGKKLITLASVNQLYEKSMEELVLSDQIGMKSLLEGEEVDWSDDRLIQMFQMLDPFYRNALKCISICTSTECKEISIPHGYRLVQMRCKYCPYMVNVKDLSKWHVVLKIFSTAHVAKSCISIPDAIQSELMKQKDQMENSSSSSPHLSIEKISEYISMLYDFLDGHKLDDKRPSSGVFVNADIKRRKRPLHDDSEQPKNVRQKKVQEMDRKKKEKQRMEMFLTDKNYPRLMPFGGVPLLSSITKSKSERLTYFQTVLLSNLELYEEDGTETNDLKPVSLRCQNCRCWTMRLRSKDSLYKATTISAPEHLKHCAFTHDSVARNLGSVLREHLNDKMDPLKLYCHFLGKVYGMNDYKAVNGQQMVVFSDSDYRLGNKYRGSNIYLEKKGD